MAILRFKAGMSDCRYTRAIARVRRSLSLSSVYIFVYVYVYVCETVWLYKKKKTKSMRHSSILCFIRAFTLVCRQLPREKAFFVIIRACRIRWRYDISRQNFLFRLMCVISFFFHFQMDDSRRGYLRVILSRD